MSSLQTLGLWLARIAVSAWVGAAVLFVIVGVSEVTTADFDSTIRDRLVVVRFPWYYATGFTLVPLGALGTAIAHGHRQLSRRAWLAALVLLLLALVGMTGDYLGIYQPLERMVTPPGQPRTAEFVTLHRWSARVNGVNLLLCAVAAGLLSWPSEPRSTMTR
ncbi:MAG: hypothetical protein SH850_24410 [Planctomycetaceae bacterium]|nr:hypothetical protein [Planctomycetaceae bacterium]